MIASSSTAKLLSKHDAQHLPMMEQNHYVTWSGMHAGRKHHICVSTSSRRLALSSHLVCLCGSSTSRCALSSHPPCSSVSTLWPSLSGLRRTDRFFHVCLLLYLPWHLALARHIWIYLKMSLFFPLQPHDAQLSNLPSNHKASWCLAASSVVLAQVRALADFEFCTLLSFQKRRKNRDGFHIIYFRIALKQAVSETSLLAK